MVHTVPTFQGYTGVLLFATRQLNLIALRPGTMTRY